MADKSPVLEDTHASSLTKVLTFDEGLELARIKIAELMKQRDTLTLSINGSGPGAGKTYLAGQIAKGLLGRGVPTGVCSHPDSFEIALHQVGYYREAFENWTQAVYIIDAWEVPHGIRKFGNIDIRGAYDERLRVAAIAFGLSLRQVDLWLAISTKTTPFISPPAWADQPYEPFEDIIIDNDEAK